MIDQSMTRYRNLRGLLALWVVIGHCSMYLDTDFNWLDYFQELNLFCVGIFFFQSGYGLCRAFEEKNDYLKGFLIKKPLRLFLIAVFSGLVNCALQVLQGRSYSSLFRFAKSVREFINWYIWVQVLFYLFFYLVYKTVRKEKARILLLALLVLASLETLRHMNLGHAYYTSGLAFPAGAAVYAFRDPLEKLLQKRRIPCIIGTALLCGVCIFLVLSLDHSWRHPVNVYGKNLLCIAVGLLGMELLTMIPVKGKVLEYLSAISLEIYLYQFVMINAVSTYLDDRKTPKHAGFVIATLVGTVILAITGAALRKRIERKR